MKGSGVFFWVMLVTLVTGWTARAQSVLATSGLDVQKGGISISQTIGELAVSTFFSDTYALTQGFHQPNYTSSQVTVLPDTPFSVSFWPNPAQEYVEIRIKNGYIETWLIELIDIQGVRLYHKETVDPVMRISLTSFSAGIYHIRVTEKVSGICKTYKLIRY